MGAHAASFTPLKREPLLRLLVADLVGEALMRESVARCARHRGTCRAPVDEMQASASGPPAPRESCG